MMDIDYRYEISFSTILWCVRLLCVVCTLQYICSLKNQKSMYKHIYVDRGAGDPGAIFYSFKLLYTFDF